MPRSGTMASAVPPIPAMATRQSSSAASTRSRPAIARTIATAQATAAFSSALILSAMAWRSSLPSSSARNAESSSVPRSAAGPAT